MPFDGNGNYNPPAPAFPAISGQVIYAADFNAVINDIAAAISNCIAKDGQSGVTANLNFGGNRIINLAPGVSATDAVTKAQVFTNPVFTTTTAEGLVVSGTGFTVTVTNTDMTATALHVALQAEGNDSDLAANTAFVQRAVATAVVAVTDGYTDLVQAEETARIAADSLLAPKLNANMTSPTISDATLTGTPTAPNPNPLTDSEQVATCHFVKQQAFQTVLPNQAGNQGKVLRTNGTDAEWAAYLEPGDILFSTRVPPVPVFLPCDSSTYLQASYPELFAEVGILAPETPYTFTSMTAPNAGIYFVAYGNGIYVALQQNTSPLLTSTNLTAWTAQSLGVTNYPNGLAFGNGLFVMSLRSENYRTSVDGLTWTARGIALTTVAFGNGFFLGRNNADSKWYKSTDGITFTLASSMPAGLSGSTPLSFVNGYFYLIDATGKLARTADGITWETLYSTAYTSNSSTLFRTVGSPNGTLLSHHSGRVLQSFDNGATWTAYETFAGLAASAISAIGYVNGLFFLLQNDAVKYSIDGITFYTGPSLGTGYTMRGSWTTGGRLFIFQDTNNTSHTAGLPYDVATQFITPRRQTAFDASQNVNAYIKTGLEI